MEAVERVEEITYARWICLDGKYEERVFITFGLEINELLLNKISKNFKIRLYNNYHQYSELKHLKKNMKENKVIFSVDFSNNYENKPFMRFKVLILGTKPSSYSLLHVILNHR